MSNLEPACLTAAGAGHELRRGNAGHRRLRTVVGCAQARRNEAVEGVQRSAVAVERAPKPDSARSICRLVPPARASCRARSTRSFRRS
jgi:hypothetical protein